MTATNRYGKIGGSNTEVMDDTDDAVREISGFRKKFTASYQEWRRSLKAGDHVLVQTDIVGRFHAEFVTYSKNGNRAFVKVLHGPRLGQTVSVIARRLQRDSTNI